MESQNINTLISIIVPVYNTEKYLRNCINSILNQTYKNLEVILVDDGSSDLSSEICDEYAKIDSRIIVVHKSNGGVSSARNYGIDICTGDYISFVDSDDYIHPLFIENLYTLLIENNADIAQSCSKFVNRFNYRNMRFKRISNRFEVISREDALLRCVHSDVQLYYCIACVKLFKKEIISSIKFDEIVNAEDIKFCIESFSKASRIAVCDEKLYFYYKHNGSATTSNRMLSINLINVFDYYDVICDHVIDDDRLLCQCKENSYRYKIDAIVEDYWIANNYREYERKKMLKKKFDDYVLLSEQNNYNLTFKHRVFESSPFLFIILRYIYMLLYKS